MKRLLKAGLFSAAVLAVMYASSPWWIPSILARQLPQDWQLGTLKISWPGISGINVQHLKATGQLAGMKVSLEADDARLSYRGFATQVESVTLHIYPSSAQDQPAQALTIDDLSLPMLRLSANLPALTVKQTKLALHLADNKQGSGSGKPIIFDLQGFSLNPTDQGHYQLDTRASIVGLENISGKVSVDVNPDRLLAQVRFPADNDISSWLALTFLQEIQAGRSELTLIFDATNQEWLDPLLSSSSAGRLTHIDGKLEAQAFFDGEQKTHLKQMELLSSGFEATFDGNRFVADARLEVSREDQTVYLKFSDSADSEPTKLSLLDQSGQIEKLLNTTIPELVRATENLTQQSANASFIIAEQSRLALTLPQNDSNPIALSFTGGLGINYSSSSSSLKLSSGNLNLAVANAGGTNEIELDADISMSVLEEQPFSYANDTLSIAADGLSLATEGKLVWEAQNIDFQSPDAFAADLPGLKANILTGTPSSPGRMEYVSDTFVTSEATLAVNLTGAGPDADISFTFDGPLNASLPRVTITAPNTAEQSVISAAELAMTGSVLLAEGQLSSSGDGYLNKAKLMPMAASAAQIELDWNGLNISNLNGALTAKTRGFKIKIEEDTWTGFDAQAHLKLKENDEISGNGNLTFEGATAIPLNFSGNTASGWWDVNLIEQTLPLADMRSILKSAHIQMPAELNLSGGTIQVDGLIQVQDEISATLNLVGKDIAADLAESSAQQTSFSLVSGYQTDVFATGPVAIEELRLAGGIDITDISTGLNVQNSDSITLNTLSAALFDGQLKTDQLNYANGAIEDTTITLTHINLQKLLAFLDVDGLQGTGFIDVSLPAGSKGAAIHIVDGTFTSTEPGRLSYSKGDMASTNIGLQALDNFHYKNLSGKIAYDSTGPYQITIHLEGNNPDLYNGYPLVFNLTINGSLPELFEAMFLTGSFEDSILKQVNLKKSQ